MAWTSDSANTSTLTNDSAYEGGVETWDDMDIAWDEAEGTWDNPKSPWKRDSANTSTITNDAANS